MISASQIWSVQSGWGWLSTSRDATTMEFVLVAIFGLLLGSFLNVVIYRLPRDQSILWPGSACPQCEHRLAPWENIPLISYLILRGKCRKCHHGISWRYPAVELLTSVILTATVAYLGVGMAAVGAAIFLVALLAVAWIDAEHRIIPNELSIGLFVIGLFVRGFNQEGFVTALIGAAMGVAALAGVAWAYKKVRRVDGLGGGDIKLAAGLGAFLGPPGLLLTIVLSSAAGSVLGIALISMRRGSGSTALPFGAFLAPAGALVLVAGPAIWQGYLALAGIPLP